MVPQCEPAIIYDDAPDLELMRSLVDRGHSAFAFVLARGSPGLGGPQAQDAAENTDHGYRQVDVKVHNLRLAD
jgi:hypothetical protein